jgi:phosphatidylglycerol:prolipoprotein diacylglycerol transferase
MDAAAHTHWVHNLDPYLIRFSGEFGIRWYGLAYLAGLAWGFWMVRRWSDRGRAPLRRPEISDLVLAGGIGMIVGGRLGYVLGYEPHLLWTFTSSLPWWGLLAVNNGGMASHGGIAGLACGAWWFCRSRKRNFPVVVDMVAATAPFGVILGRITNFVNGELYGRPSDLPWAVIFPAARDGVARHPSQLYAAVLEGLIPLCIALPLHARHRRPGLTTGLVIVLYSIGRFFGEFFRLPDAGQPGGPALFGHDAVPAILGFMSKGQFYTLPLLVVGIIVCIWALRRPAAPETYLPPT